MVRISLLLPMVLACMVSGWMYLTKQDSVRTYNDVPLFYTSFYTSLESTGPIAILVALIIHIFKVGFLSALCYFGILVVAQYLNFAVIYPVIYRNLFGYRGIGVLIPVALILPLLGWVYIEL